MAYLCCTKTVILNGLLKPNKKFFAKHVDGSYWTVGSQTTTINLEFQNLRVDTGEAGTGRPPFSCVIPILAGPQEGNASLVYWDDSRNAPPPRKGVKRTKDGEISTLVNYLKGDKAPYWFNEYLRHVMGLMNNCREKAMENFSATSRVDMNESTLCSKSYRSYQFIHDRDSSKGHG